MFLAVFRIKYVPQWLKIRHDICEFYCQYRDVNIYHIEILKPFLLQFEYIIEKYDLRKIYQIYKSEMLKIKRYSVNFYYIFRFFDFLANVFNIQSKLNNITSYCLEFKITDNLRQYILNVLINGLSNYDNPNIVEYILDNFRMEMEMKQIEQCMKSLDFQNNQIKYEFYKKYYYWAGLCYQFYEDGRGINCIEEIFQENAKLKELIIQQQDYIHHLEYSPDPGPKFLATQQHFENIKK